MTAHSHRLSEQPAEPGMGAIVATGSVTDGHFGKFRGLMTPGTVVAGHFHRTFSDSFYLLDSEVQLFDGDRWGAVNKGDLVYVPAGGIHAVKVPADLSAEVLTILSPGVAQEQFVYELLDITRTDRVLTPDEWTGFYRRHDQYMV